MVDCEWDPAKAAANFAKHGIYFADAVSALSDDLALTIRDPYSENEDRWITVGTDVLGRVLVIVYTWRNEKAFESFRRGKRLHEKGTSMKRPMKRDTISAREGAGR